MSPGPRRQCGRCPAAVHRKSGLHSSVACLTNATAAGMPKKPVLYTVYTVCVLYVYTLWPSGRASSSLWAKRKLPSSIVGARVVIYTAW